MSQPEGPPSDFNDQISEAASLGSVGTAGSTSGLFAISPAGNDVDMFSFQVAAGQTVGFDIDNAAGSTLDATMRLFDAAGNALRVAESVGFAPDEDGSTNNIFEGYFEFTFATAGTFFVGVSAFGNSNYDPITGTGDAIGSTTGDYRLALTNRFATLANGGQSFPTQLTATGTSGVDELIFDVDPATGDVITTLNGESLRFLAGRLTGEQVLDGGEGNDNVRPLRVGTAANPDTYSVVARGGLGFDRFFVGQNGDLDSSIFGTLTIDSEPNSSTADDGEVILGNSADTDGTFIFDESAGLFQTFDKANSDLGLIQVDVDDTFVVTFFGGGGTNTYDIREVGENLAAGAGNSIRIDLLTGAANDTFLIGNANGDFDGFFTGSLRIEPGTGDDTLTLNDSVDQDGNETYDFTTVFGDSGFSLQKPGTDFGGLSLFAPVDTLNLFANDGDTTVNLGNDLDEIAAVINLDAGNGTNTLNVLDDNDLADSFGATGAYLFTDGSITKPGNAEPFAELNYSGFETAALTGSQDENLFDVVDQNDLDLLTINGNAAGDTFDISPFNGNLDRISQRVVVNGGAGVNSLFANDAFLPFNDDYLVTPTTIGKTNISFTDLITFGDIDDVTLRTTDSTNTIEIEGVAAGTSVTINAGDGDDTFDVGNGDLDANLLGTLTLDGGTGTDDLIVDDTTDDAGNDDYLIFSGLIEKRATQDPADPLVNFSNTESTVIDGSPQRSTYRVASHDVPLTINAGADIDVIRLTDLSLSGDLDNISAPLTFNGGGTVNALSVDDRADSGADAYEFAGNVTLATLVKPGNTEGFTSATFVGLDQLLFIANNEANVITVDADLPLLTFNGGNGDDTINIEGNDPATPVLVRGEGGADTVNINPDGGAPASVRFDKSEVLSRLQLFDGASLTVDAGGDKIIDLIETNLLFATNPGNAIFDLNDNALVIRDITNNPFLRDRIALGYNGGGWDGTKGFTSSVARDSDLSDGLAYGTAGELGISQIFGDHLADADSVVTYALLGDADASGSVNLADFGRLRGSFGSSAASWADGDFNYDGTVNLADFGLLRSNFGRTLSNLGASSLFDID